MKIQVAGEELTLSSEKVLYWEQQKILLLSDVHLGKAESFQAAGIPLPSGDHIEEFQRLEKILGTYPAQRIFILGDFIHQKDSWAAPLLKDIQDFFQKHKNIQWHLLIGNHDKGSKHFLESLHLILHEEDIEIEPFVFTHGHKQNKSDLIEIRGHLHPRIHLQQGPLRLNLPCFWLEKNRLTLPSFGSLTGGFKIKPAKADRVFAVGGNEVFEIPR